MSIIHDALKKVQQGLNLKPNEPPVSSSTPTQSASGYLYETPPTAENLQPTAQQAATPKTPVQNKIKSIFAMACALAITVISILYIGQQVQNKIPQVQVFVRKSLNQLNHKKPSDLKTLPPADLKPLAQVTINPSTNKSSAKLGPETLAIHGIMANGSGNLVLINDQVYQEGDEIDGAKITKIDLNSIKIINNGIEQTIFVKN